MYCIRQMLLPICNSLSSLLAPWLHQEQALLCKLVVGCEVCFWHMPDAACLAWAQLASQSVMLLLLLELSLVMLLCPNLLVDLYCSKPQATSVLLHIIYHKCVYSICFSVKDR